MALKHFSISSREFLELLPEIVTSTRTMASIGQLFATSLCQGAQFAMPQPSHSPKRPAHHLHSARAPGNPCKICVCKGMRKWLQTRDDFIAVAHEMWVAGTWPGSLSNVRCDLHHFDAGVDWKGKTSRNRFLAASLTAACRACMLACVTVKVELLFVAF